MGLKVFIPCIYSFSFKVANQNFLPVSGRQFTVFVVGDEKEGVVGLHGANLTCLTCQQQDNSCEHVRKLTASEQDLMNEMPDFLVDFFAEKSYRSSSTEASTTRREWCQKPVSQNKIEFDLTASQKENFSALEQVLQSKLSSDGLVQLKPEFSTRIDAPVCPKCLTQCIEQSSRRVPCFLKKKVFHCEGKYNFNTWR